MFCYFFTLFSKIFLLAFKITSLSDFSFSSHKKPLRLFITPSDAQLFLINTDGKAVAAFNASEFIANGFNFDENSFDENGSQISDEKKNIYTLEYFDEDAKTALSAFFKVSSSRYSFARAYIA